MVEDKKKFETFFRELEILKWNNSVFGNYFSGQRGPGRFRVGDV